VNTPAGLDVGSWNEAASPGAADLSSVSEMTSARGSGRWARRATGVLLSLVAVGLVTGAVFVLRPVAPVLSLGVLYVIAVVAVAVVCGLAYAIPVSVASMLTRRGCGLGGAAAE
jgi:K+-sensing histidine kinase KdpD